MAYPQPVTKLMVQIRRELLTAVALTWEQVEIPVPPKGIIRRIRWSALDEETTPPRIGYLLATVPFDLGETPPEVVGPPNRLLTSFPVLFAGGLDHVPGYSMYLPLTAAPPLAVASPGVGAGQGPSGQFLDFYEADSLHLAWTTNSIEDTVEIQIDIEVVGA